MIEKINNNLMNMQIIICYRHIFCIYVGIITIMYKQGETIMDHKRNKKYFKDSIIALIFGVLLCLLIATISIISLVGLGEGSISDYIGGIIIPLAVSALFIFLCIREHRNKPTDAEYDASIREMYRGIEQKACDKFGIELSDASEISPIVVGGFDYSDLLSAVIGGVGLAKKGKDGLWRTNKYIINVLLLSSAEVYCYSCSFCTTELQINETTDQFFYQDISSVSTGTDTIKIKNNSVSIEYLTITSTSGKNLRFSMANPDETAKASINKMRQLIKQKKNQ